MDEMINIPTKLWSEYFILVNQSLEIVKELALSVRTQEEGKITKLMDEYTKITYQKNEVWQKMKEHIPEGVLIDLI